MTNAFAQIKKCAMPTSIALGVTLAGMGAFKYETHRLENRFQGAIQSIEAEKDKLRVTQSLFGITQSREARKYQEYILNHLIKLKEETKIRRETEILVPVDPDATAFWDRG